MSRRSGTPSAKVPPTHCPQCGSSNLAKVVYGEPVPSAVLEADIRAGRVVLGGCIVTGEQPTDHCRDCGKEFRASPRKGYTAQLLPASPRPGSWRVGRLVLTGAAQSVKDPPDRTDLLAAALDAIAREEIHVRYLVTPAGFFEPRSPRELGLRHGWETKQGDFDIVRRLAAEGVTPQLADAFARARGHVDYLVVGADVHGLGHRAYGETALVYDVATKAPVASTGKSYPTTEQERKLIRNPDARGHVLDLGGETVAVFVCHDLQAWSPRGASSRGAVRAAVAGDLDQALRDARPTAVLHLPHTTHTPRTWMNPWAAIKRILPGAAWASAIKYRNGDHRPEAPLGPELLASTRSGSGEVLDIVLGDHTAM
jgi:hypothetical protein